MPPETLQDSPRSALLGYPSGSKTAYIVEMRRMGVDGVALYGRVLINGHQVLGKGHTGVVMLVRASGAMAALKMRRTDSPRPDMGGEAVLLATANQAGIGPRLLGYTSNLLLMEYLDGTPLKEWLVSRPPVRLACDIISRIIWQCYTLDRMGMDHGELTDMSRHAIIGSRTTLIDFESASLSRRPANVTSAVQCLFLGSLSGHTRRLCSTRPGDIIAALRAYKSRPNGGTFGCLLYTLGCLQNGGTGEIRTHDL